MRNVTLTVQDLQACLRSSTHNVPINILSVLSHCALTQWLGKRLLHLLLGEIDRTLFIMIESKEQYTGWPLILYTGISPYNIWELFCICWCRSTHYATKCCTVTTEALCTSQYFRLRFRLIVNVKLYCELSTS